MSTENFAGVIDAYVNPDNKEDAQIQSLNTLILAIHQQKLSVQKLVELLGDYLTNVNESVRSRGTLLLSEILTRLPTLPLNDQSLQYLGDFYVARLQDFPCINEVLKGLFALVKNHKLNNNALCISICKTIFSEVHTQSLAQNSRKLVFDIISILVEKYTSELKAIGGDIVVGFIQAMEGEKDPRILLQVFKVVPIIVKNVPEYKNYAEDLFEVIACYFPVTFNPRVGDPEGITRKHLVDALRDCMGCCSEFGEYGVPFFLEKLSSTVIETKVESLETLSVCAPVYNQELLPYIEDLWSSLRTELTTNKENSVIQAALSTLQSLIQVYSKMNNMNSGLQEFLDLVRSQCLHELQAPDSKIVQISGKILQAAAKSSVESSNYLISTSLSLLISEYDSKLRLSHKHNILEIIVEYIRSTQNIAFNEKHPLHSFIEKLYNMINGALLDKDSENLRKTSVEGLKLLVKQRLISDVQIQHSVQRICDKLLDSKEDEHVRGPCLEAIKEFSQEFSSLLMEIVVPKIFGLLKTPIDDKQYTNHIFHCVTTLCQSPIIFKQVTSQFLELLSNYFSDVNSSNLLQACLKSLTRICFNNKENTSLALSNIISPLISLFINNSAKNSAKVSDEVISSTTQFLKMICQQISADEQLALTSEFVKIFIHGNGVTTNSTESQRQLVILFSSVVVPLKEDVPETQAVLNLFVAFSQDSIEEVASASCQATASILNKWKNEQNLEIFLAENIEKGLVADIKAQNGLLSNKVKLLSWVAKGLLLRGHKYAWNIVQVMLDKLSSDIGGLISPNMEILLEETSSVLSKETNATIKVLYKQKFFNSALPQLLEGFKQSSVSYKSNYLVAISKLLKHIPQTVLLAELPNILPILLQSMSSEEVSIRVSTLETFLMLTTEATSLVEQHLSSLVPKLVELAAKDPAMEARSLACKCLFGIAQLPYPKIFPFKMQVVNGLLKAVDDNKRVVRKDASKARNEWFTISA